MVKGEIGQLHRRGVARYPSGAVELGKDSLDLGNSSIAGALLPEVEWAWATEPARHSESHQVADAFTALLVLARMVLDKLSPPVYLAQVPPFFEYS